MRALRGAPSKRRWKRCPAYSRPQPDAKAGTAVIRMLPDTPDDALTKAVEEAGYLPHGMR